MYVNHKFTLPQQRTLFPGQAQILAHEIKYDHGQDLLGKA